MNAYQYIIICLLIAQFMLMLYQDVNGRKEREPAGYPGIVASVIVTAIIVWIYYKAGLFEAHL